MKSVDFLRNILHINDEHLLRELATRSEISTVKKGEYLIRQGQNPILLHFLVEGIFRGSLISINGKDITDCIVSECGFPLVANPNIWGVAQIGIEALTDATVWSIALKDITALIPRFPVLSQMYRDFLMWSNQMHWELKVITYQYTALQRYRWFLKTYPDLIDKISHKHIASFLNMTPVTFSKLIHASDDFMPAEVTPLVMDEDC